MLGKTRKRDANDLPEQNHPSLKVVVETCFIRVMLKLKVLRSSSISRAIVKYESFCSISITRIGVRGAQISADEICPPVLAASSSAAIGKFDWTIDSLIEWKPRIEV